MFEDTRVKTASFNYSDYPYTVVFVYKIIFKEYLDLPDWHPQPDFRVSVQNASQSVSVPPGVQIKYKPLHFDAKPEILEDKKRVLYTWNIKNLPAIDSEPYSPGFNVIAPRLLLSKLKIDYGNVTGQNNSWISLGQFFYDLNKGLDTLPESAKKRVHELSDSLSSDREKAMILFDELQRTTRYVNISLDIGGHKSYDANYVYKNNYGDCKALSNYMMALLKEAGIKSYWALVMAGDKKPGLIQNFSSSQFNHVILAIPSDTDTTWLECTNQDIPFGYLGNFTENRHVLLITPEGGFIAKTPAYDASDNCSESMINARITDEGLLLLDARFLKKGTQSVYYEHVLKHYSRNEQEAWLYSKLNMPSIKINEFAFSRPDQNNSSLQLDIKTESSHYISRSGSRLFLNPAVFHKLTRIPRNELTRTLPVYNEHPYLTTDSNIFKLPESYQIESLPDLSRIIDSEFGKYQATIVFDEKTSCLIYTRSFELNRFEKSADQYEAFRTFLKHVAKADKRQVVLKKITGL
jgi:hypothetical protein